MALFSRSSSIATDESQTLTKSQSTEPQPGSSLVFGFPWKHFYLQRVCFCCDSLQKLKLMKLFSICSALSSVGHHTIQLFSALPNNTCWWVRTHKPVCQYVRWGHFPESWGKAPEHVGAGADPSPRTTTDRHGSSYGRVSILDQIHSCFLHRVGLTHFRSVACLWPGGCSPPRVRSRTRMEPLLSHFNVNHSHW